MHHRATGQVSRTTLFSVLLDSVRWMSVFAFLASGSCVSALMVSVGWLAVPISIVAQTAKHEVGTVTSVTGKTVMLQSAAGAQVTVILNSATTFLLLPAGSKNLKAATPASLANIAIGDRVLATGSAGSNPGTLTAARVIVMKSADITALNASQQADWRHRGVSGVVRGVEAPVVTISAAERTIQVNTTPATVFRRYAAGSVSFSAATPSTLSGLRVGDELSVRGVKSADGTEIAAEEIVSGTFENLSGAIASIDVQAQTLTIKDLVTKMSEVVQITPQSDLRSLPVDAARSLAVRNHSGSKSTPASPASSSAKPNPKGEADPTRNAGMDLSRMLPQLPQQKLSDLKVGDAVLIVASRADGAGPLTAITMLSGVEQLLSARSAGAKPITLSPWDLAAPDTGPSQ